MSTIIKVENLSKRYTIGHRQEQQYPELRDAIHGGLRALGNTLAKSLTGKIRLKPSLATEDFWALRDVDFDIQQGERVGIIGRNGAGKSTLLKVLSRITEPTSGKITINGRVASLLEVGTGFHPELTGRENIFLNGAILGMTKSEIKNRFDEIVEFAEVERFLDTPVKRYSSGMYVRLAFAVAAHLEPEVLIVDEVLAVGDVQFQRKCLGKIREVGSEGRTILFVSHNMAAIQQICSRAILLADGAVKEDGPIDKVTEIYLKSMTNVSNVKIGSMPRKNKEYGQKAKYTDAWPVNSIGQRIESFRSGEKISFNLEIKSFEKLDNLSLVAGLETSSDHRITTVLSEEEGALFAAEKNETICTNLAFPGLNLKPGTYSLTLGIRRNRDTFDHLIKAIYFDVTEISANNKFREQHIEGDIVMKSDWHLLNNRTVENPLK